MELSKSNNETRIVGEFPAINVEYLEPGQKAEPAVETDFNFFDFRVDTMEFGIVPTDDNPLEIPQETLQGELLHQPSNPYEKHYAGQFEDYKLQAVLEALINTPSES